MVLSSFIDHCTLNVENYLRSIFFIMHAFNNLIRNNSLNSIGLQIKCLLQNDHMNALGRINQFVF